LRVFSYANKEEKLAIMEIQLAVLNKGEEKYCYRSDSGETYQVWPFETEVV